MIQAFRPAGSHVVAAGASSAAGSAAPKGVVAVRVVAYTNDARIDIGPTPTATATSAYLPVGRPEVFLCAESDKVAAIQASAGGFVSVTWLTR